jgi:hypothetical protein
MTALVPSAELGFETATAAPWKLFPRGTFVRWHDHAGIRFAASSLTTKPFFGHKLGKLS